MKYIKKFEAFTAAEPATAPPTTKPGTKPTTKPNKPNKDRPSPVRRDKPSIEPDPKASKVSMKKATAESVANRFIRELNANGESVKKYLKK